MLNFKKKSIFFAIFLLAKICRQQNTADKHAGLRAQQTSRARLAVWTASQNYVLLFQPVAFIPASAGQKSQTRRHLFTEPISAFRQPTSFYLSPIPVGKAANQSAKIAAKKAIKKGSRSFLRKITVRTYQLLPHNVQQFLSFCMYKLHIKTRPAAGTSWRNISFHQNVPRICQRHSLRGMSCYGSLH